MGTPNRRWTFELRREGVFYSPDGRRFRKLTEEQFDQISRNIRSYLSTRFGVASWTARGFVELEKRGGNPMFPSDTLLKIMKVDR